MKMTQEGIDLIRNFEGCKLHAYRDAVGIPTIGFGETRGVHMGMVWTQIQADSVFAARVEEFAKGVAALIKHPISDSAFSACVSLSYNIGIGAFMKSSVLRDINMGQIPQAADAFLRWNQGGGKVLAGLVRRRAAERALFLS
jgi:lysozyme